MKTQKIYPISEQSRIDGRQTSDDMPFTQIVNEIAVLTTVILRTVPTTDVIDKVTVVNGYAEFVISHPDVLGLRQCLARS